MGKAERFVIFLIFIALGIMFLFPTFKWYYIIDDDLKKTASGTMEDTRAYSVDNAQKILNFLMTSSSISESDSYYKVAKQVAKKYCRKNNKKLPKLWDRESILSAFLSENDAFKAFEEYYRDLIIRTKKTASKAFKFGLDLRGGMSVLLEGDVDSFSKKIGHSATQSDISEAISDDAEILKTRVDQFGVSEAEIRTQGSAQILIELPGEVDPERVNSFLKGKGRLEFIIVDAKKTSLLNEKISQNSLTCYDEKGNLKKDMFSSILSSNNSIAAFYSTDDYGMEKLEDYYVLDDSRKMNASYITNVETGRNGITGQPVVNFHMSKEGGDLFYDLTSKSKGEPMAVVMDGKIKNVATINDAIRSDVQVSGFNEDEAKSLSIILKTASLPMELNVVSLQSVGASLGEDTINRSYKAFGIGFALICLFMLVMYGIPGILSSFMLLFNLFFMLSILSGLGFTLTLSSLSGLVLTLGMAVDSFVIIFEGIKERLKKGQYIDTAVLDSYKRSFLTLVDANITTLIASVVLSFLGSTAVKGFAITLTVGVLCSLFTSLFVSRLMFDIFIVGKNRNRMFFGLKG